MVISSMSCDTKASRQLHLMAAIHAPTASFARVRLSGSRLAFVLVTLENLSGSMALMCFAGWSYALSGCQ